MFTYEFNGNKNFISKSDNFKELKESIIDEDMITMTENDIMLFYDQENKLINTIEDFNIYTKSKDNVVIVKIQNKNNMKIDNTNDVKKINNDDIKKEPEKIEPKIQKNKK